MNRITGRFSHILPLYWAESTLALSASAFSIQLIITQTTAKVVRRQRKHDSLRQKERARYQRNLITGLCVWGQYLDRLIFSMSLSAARGRKRAKSEPRKIKPSRSRRRP